MKKIKRWFREIFTPGDIDLDSVMSALADPTIRSAWLTAHLEEIKAINLDVDRRLLSGTEFGLIDLCARRKAFHDVLLAILSARRRIVTTTTAQAQRPNPSIKVDVNFDRVTA